EAALQSEPRPRAAEVDERLAEFPERLHDRLAVLDGAAVARGHGNHRLAVERGREGPFRRDTPEERQAAELLWRRAHGVAPGGQQPSSILGRVEDRAHGDHRPDGVRLELERGDDAEVTAGAANRPEEIVVLVRARAADRAVRGDDVDRKERVDREPVLSAQMTGAAVQGQPRDARRGNDACGHSEAVQLRLTVEVAERSTTLYAHRLCRWIDVNTTHRREVDHHPA